MVWNILEAVFWLCFVNQPQSAEKVFFQWLVFYYRIVDSSRGGFRIFTA
jgi:hypothetical protein